MYTTFKDVLSPDTKQTVCNNEVSTLIRCSWSRVWLKRAGVFREDVFMCISVSMDLLCMILTVNHRISSNVLKLQIPYTVHVQEKDYFQECLDVHVPPLGLLTSCSAILKFSPYPRVALFQKLFWPPALSSQKKAYWAVGKLRFVDFFILVSIPRFPSPD